MNIIAKTLVLAAVSAATLSVFALAYEGAAPQKIVKLERVVIVGKRMEVAQLPRVYVEGHRAGGSTQVAKAAVCQDRLVC
ncbi:hypothetical protein [Pelomonas sp. SE-A7]|uniref:hypothetical protein n=1 Tax=Pelomonas sp. SE-A7 TaxID=3054953 RepID=UPI00259CD064|nr:hypothetical protein [Pelomonas sp. SE-A7]MDM4767040.1 hypothetical protein [Pelomonas sp. SE-A7]